MSLVTSAGGYRVATCPPVDHRHRDSARDSNCVPPNPGFPDFHPTNLPAGIIGVQLFLFVTP